MLTNELHSHTVGNVWAFAFEPTAVYVHAHPHGYDEHDHPDMARLEKAIRAKENRPRLYSVRQDGSDLTDLGEIG